MDRDAFDLLMRVLEWECEQMSEPTILRFQFLAEGEAFWLDLRQSNGKWTLQLIRNEEMPAGHIRSHYIGAMDVTGKILAIAEAIAPDLRDDVDEARTVARRITAIAWDTESGLDGVALKALEAEYLWLTEEVKT
jgi:hypothetical protein